MPKPPSSSSLIKDGKVAINKENFGPPEISYTELEFIERIGAGAYGEVWIGKCRNYTVAIKKLFKQNLDEAALNAFRKEVQTCSLINHPNVSLFMGACLEPGNLCIVTEYYEKGNLEMILKNPDNKLSLQTKFMMARDTAQGMCWLHNTDPVIFHRDLKPPNLLIDKNGHIRVCDFGLATLKKSNQKIRDVLNIPGSPIWLAPEVLLGKDIDETADIYAYGLCVWQLLTNSVNPYPFIKTLAELKREICQKHTRPPLDSFKEESIREFLSACWHRLPDKRPSFREIVHLIDHILVDIAISDPLAREFWKAKYLGKQQVEFVDFTNQLSNYFNIHLSDVQRHCLSLTIGIEHKDGIMEPVVMVPIEKFGKFLENFGPIYLEKTGKSGEIKVITAFDRLYDVCKNDWYYGDLDKEDCKEIMKSAKPGDFLVRISSTVSGCFSVTFVRLSQLKHHRIEFNSKTGQYSTVVKKNSVRISSDSLAEIVYENLAPEFGLTNAFGTSPFHEIQTNPDVQGGGGYDVPNENVFLTEDSDNIPTCL